VNRGHHGLQRPPPNKTHARRAADQAAPVCGAFSPGRWAASEPPSSCSAWVMSALSWESLARLSTRAPRVRFRVSFNPSISRIGSCESKDDFCCVRVASAPVTSETRCCRSTSSHPRVADVPSQHAAARFVGCACLYIQGTDGCVYSQLQPFSQELTKPNTGSGFLHL